MDMKTTKGKYLFVFNGINDLIEIYVDFTDDGVVISTGKVKEEDMPTAKKHLERMKKQYNATAEGTA